MTALKAHVKNGRIVVDEPVDLPEGAEVSVYLYDAAADDLPPHERAALARSLERGLAQADAGDLIDEIEINPLFVLDRGAGVLVGDALLTLRAPDSK